MLIFLIFDKLLLDIVNAFAGNIQKIASITGAKEFHLSGRVKVEGHMRYRNPAVSMGGTVQIAEYERDVTSVDKVKAAIQALEI